MSISGVMSIMPRSVKICCVGCATQKGLAPRFRLGYIRVSLFWRIKQRTFKNASIPPASGHARRHIRCRLRVDGTKFS
jgi:hypothetical protein